MAPHAEPEFNMCSKSRMFSLSKSSSKLSSEGLSRTVSDISVELTKEVVLELKEAKLQPISEVEDAKCECCGMTEECTTEYIDRVRGKFSGKWICGLCSEAVKEGMEKNGGKGEEALSSHMSACARFNKFGRAYPILYQAEAMREMFKKNAREGVIRGKSISPRDVAGGPNKGGLARSSSCIPAITKDLKGLKI
uniref:DUF1677 family protein n=1 Tax=Kalanchoe fedtschenkoi TaxID=63787 RepID=A0A7N0U3H4_KALFE